MKRKFTKQEKLHIIKEASEQGVKATLEKQSIRIFNLDGIVLLHQRRFNNIIGRSIRQFSPYFITQT